MKKIKILRMKYNYNISKINDIKKKNTSLTSFFLNIIGDITNIGGLWI